MAAVFQMGYAKEDLPMPAGTPLGGYGWGTDRRSGGTVANPLRVRCAIIVDPTGQRVVFIQADVISIPRPVYEDIVRHLVAVAVITSARQLVLAQSHTHSGPMIGSKPDPYVLLDSRDAADVARAYTIGFVDIVRRVAVAARNQPLTRVTLGYAEGYAELGFNRRGWLWKPREVPVLVARRVDNYDLFAVLAGHACHPVCVDRAANPDAEYCGYAMDETEKRLGVPVMFFQGAAGDIDPNAPDRDQFKIQTAALRLTSAIVATVRNAAYFPINGPLTTAIETVELPYRVDLDNPAERAWLKGQYEQRVAAAGGPGGADGEGEDAAAVRHALQMLEELKGQIPNHMPMTIQRISFGGLTILTMSHEVLSGWHVGTKSQWAAKRPYEPLWIMAYANHIDCYVPAYDTLTTGDAQFEGEAGWRNDREDDKRVSGVGTFAVSYSLIAPLEPGSGPDDANGVEGRLVPRIRALLGIT